MSNPIDQAIEKAKAITNPLVEKWTALVDKARKKMAMYGGMVAESLFGIDGPMERRMLRNFNSRVKQEWRRKQIMHGEYFKPYVLAKALREQPVNVPD